MSASFPRSVPSSPDAANWRVCIAPMMDWTAIT
jgi:hypothetical protein